MVSAVPVKRKEKHIHYLHRILVYIPDVSSVEYISDRNEKISAIRSYAESATDNFYERAFDWRETENLGDWSFEDGSNVFLSSEHPDEFAKLLHDMKEAQSAEIDYYISRVKEAAGTEGIDLIAKQILSKDADDGGSGDPSNLMSYYLLCLAQLLNGEYICESYDVRRATTFVANAHSAPCNGLKSIMGVLLCCLQSIMATMP